MAKVLSVLGVFSGVCGALAAREADEIKSLPGWTGDLPSKQYSGYLDAGKSPTDSAGTTSCF